ncbi:MAG: hypothetical protein ACJAZY_003037 [Spirosomataceae bacterium]
MGISFNSANLFANLQDVNFRNATTIKTNKRTYAVPFATIQGVESISFPISGLPKLNLQPTFR